MDQPASPPPPLGAVLETALYVEDLGRARGFYEDVLGLQPMFEDGRVAAYPVGASVFLLFQQGTTTTPAKLPGGTIPAHGANGSIHYAFAIAPSNLEAWREHLHGHRVAIEGEVAWPRGGHSLYFRDPDGHLLELATPGIWSNY